MTGDVILWIIALGVPTLFGVGAWMLGRGNRASADENARGRAELDTIELGDDEEGAGRAAPARPVGPGAQALAAPVPAGAFR